MNNNKIVIVVVLFVLYRLYKSREQPIQANVSPPFNEVGLGGK